MKKDDLIADCGRDDGDALDEGHAQNGKLQKAITNQKAKKQNAKNGASALGVAASPFAV